MKNELHLKQLRNLFTEDSTISTVETDNELICYFLEDCDRGLTSEMNEAETAEIKVKAETCIGYGTYKIDLTLSNRFQIWLPVLLNVVGFAGIRQHKGNKKGDTEGCQLPGLKKGVDCISDSTGGFYKLLYIYLNHLTLDSLVAQQLVALHKEGKIKSKEFGELFNKHRVLGQVIIITISK